MNNIHGLEVGQKLVLAYRGEVHGEAVVTKLGRLWATIEYGDTWKSIARVALDDLRVHDDDRLYGEVYLSREHMTETIEAERKRRHLVRCWSDFCGQATHYRLPEGLTIEALQAAANLIGFTLPTQEQPK